MSILKQTQKIIAVVDTETDPFSYGNTIAPFTVGFFDGFSYIDFWGDDCVDQFFAYLTTLDDEYIIYAHNGGKFDFHFFLNYLDQHKKPLIMHNRLAKIFIGGQEFRDSYSIIPIPLGKYKKDDIEYWKLERKNREKHKLEILSYQKSDCRYLYELVIEFHKLFGDQITTATAAMNELTQLHHHENFNDEYTDNKFRQFYYGGRNQCFEKGILLGNWKIFDRNSMYPAVMNDILHPISNEFASTNTITKNTDFAIIEAENDNCLPIRLKNGSLDFSTEYGIFYASIHEINAGLETNTIRIKRVLETIQFTKKSTFSLFVEKFYALRQKAKSENDEIRNLLYKLILNSAYGKFAINPRNFKEWEFTIDEIMESDDWSLESQLNNIMIWSRPNPKKNAFLNVATAASITGAARANLHKNIQNSTRPIYCDTDSIICEDFIGDIDPNRLGAWKLEATGSICAIAGKKMYALIDGKNTIKKAHKGVQITADDIIDICNGKTIIHEKISPTFRLGADQKFTKRQIKMT